MPFVPRQLLNPITVPLADLGQAVRLYRPGLLRADLVAGLTVSVVEVPQAMAYALIAGVPPEYGLYTSIVQGLLGALFASNRHLATGPTNTQSLLIVATVGGLVPPATGMREYLALVIALTLIKGLIQLAFAAARMGSLVRYVSQSVIVGFTAGAGVLIAVGQIGNFLGVEGGETSALPGVLGRIQQLWPVLDQVNLLAVGVGVLALALVVGARLISRLVPGPLLAVLVPGALVYLMGWTGTDLTLVRELPKGLPAPVWPWEGVSWKAIESLLSGGFALALLGMIESVGIGKSIASRTGERINANHEFFTQGLANCVGSFFQNVPGSGSFTRSALNYMAGGKTRLARVYGALLVGAIFLLFGGLAQYIPLAALAGILFVIAYNLMDWRYLARIIRTSRSDAVVGLITFASALLLPLAYAIYVGVFLNLAVYLRRASHLHMAEMVRTSEGPFIEQPVRDRTGEKKVMFLQIEGDLFFGLADELQDRLTAVAAGQPRVVILRLKRTHSIDATCLHVMEQFVQQMHAKDGHVLLCGVHDPLYEKLSAYGLLQRIGSENVFPTRFGVFASAQRALQRAKGLVGGSIDIERELASHEDDVEGWAYQI